MHHAHIGPNTPFDVYSPREIAKRLETACVAKAATPLLSLVMLGILAGAFIGLGSLFCVIVLSDAGLGFAVARVLGGVVFSLGLLLVVVAGAELFTGNNLVAMAWAQGSVTTRDVLQNWVVVCAANFAGAAGLAAVVFLSGHAAMNDGAIGETYLRIAAGKSSLPFWTAFWRGVLCNVLVCMAIWMTLAGRSVVDKAVAIVFPISASSPPASSTRWPTCTSSRSAGCCRPRRASRCSSPGLRATSSLSS
jgi:formate transporter